MLFRYNLFHEETKYWLLKTVIKTTESHYQLVSLKFLMQEKKCIRKIWSIVTMLTKMWGIPNVKVYVK